MSYKRKFFYLEKKCGKETFGTFKREFKFLDDLLDFYTTLSQNMNYNKKHLVDLQDLSIFILNLKIINSISCTKSLLKYGYYNDASNVLRNIHESRFLSQYFMKDSNAAERWIDGERISYSTVIKKISIPDIENDGYRILCNFTHSNFPGVEDHLLLERKYPVKNHKTKIDLRVHPSFNKKILAPLIYFQMSESVDSMISFYSYFNRYYWINFDAKYANKKEKLKKRFSKMFTIYLQSFDEDND